MKLAVSSMEQAVALLDEYNGGAHGIEQERRRLDEAMELSAREFHDLGLERYYRESEYLKYELLRWHLETPHRWAVDFRFLRHMRPGTVVDYGAGIGLSAFTYASAGHPVIAVEISLDCDTVRFGRFLAERLGLEGVTFSDRVPDGPVANVVSIETFEHFPDWTRPARELIAALEPGGIFCMTASFESGEDHPEHPYHFDSPVEPTAFLQEIGLVAVAPNVWRKT